MVSELGWVLRPHPPAHPLLPGVEEGQSEQQRISSKGQRSESVTVSVSQTPLIVTEVK